MNIIQESVRFFNTQVLPTISKRHKKLFCFGFQALTMQSYASLNANARMVVANRGTAESKIFRLVSNRAIPEYFASLIKHLHLVSSQDMVNVDFSSFAGFEVLTFAKQTQLGRSLPLHFNTIRYPIDEHSQTIFIMGEIKTFRDGLGFCPPLVLDRGFESPYIVPFLVGNGITFYLRMRKDKHVMYRGKDIPLRNLPWYEKDSRITIYGMKLRIIVSEKQSERRDSEGKEESWYILTNDYTSPKEKVIASYYFRFEIEETFKDLKHVNKLKHIFPIQQPLTFTILLWFYNLFIWLSFFLKKMQLFLINRIKQKKRKRLSITRYFFEQIQQAKQLLLWENLAM